jgi:hypothetical protein
LDLGDSSVVIDELLAALDDGSGTYETNAFLEGIGVRCSSLSSGQPSLATKDAFLEGVGARCSSLFISQPSLATKDAILEGVGARCSSLSISQPPLATKEAFLEGVGVRTVLVILRDFPRLVERLKLLHGDPMVCLSDVHAFAPLEALPCLQSNGIPMACLSDVRALYQLTL